MPPAPALMFPEASRADAIAALRQHVAEHLDEPIGDLKAALLLDFFVGELGPTIYNLAIADARAYFDERTADLGAICYHAEFPTSVKRKR